ncbi:MAG: histidine phosphatase family protein [Roseobacter sp.]
MRLILTLLFTLLPTLALANDWDSLSEPGAVAIMRHALAPGGGDPANFDIADCTTQRNLDDRGRDQARAIGAALRDRGFTFDRVLTSQWCRCRDTATLLDVGPVTEAPALNSFFQDRSTSDAQTADAQGIISATEGTLMMVTHQVNITALTGVFPSSGEIIVIRATDTGVEVLGKIEIAP